MYHKVKQILKYLMKMIYLNNSVVLFKHITHTVQEAPVIIMLANQENIQDVLNFQEEIFLNIFRKFIENGDVGYLAYLNEKCVHRSWVKCKPQDVNLHRFLKMRLLENETFIHYCETSPDARGKNIYPNVLCKIADDFKDKTNIFISADAENIASIKGMIKAGFEEVSIINITIILGFKLLKYTNKSIDLPHIH